jgi:hypothetical protein
MKRLAVIFVGTILACVPAHAQLMIRTVSSCGGLSLSAGAGSILFQDLTGQLCTSSSGGGGGSVTQGTSPWVDNITQWGSVAVLANAGTVGTGSPRVAVGQDPTTIAGSAPGTAGTASANVMTVQGVASMTPVQSSADPCSYSAKTSLAISTNATALTQIIAASGSTKIYVCSISLIAAGATAFNLNTGTGTNCGTSTAALLGSATAANGLSFAANGGLTLGSGEASVLVTAASSEICTLQSNAVFVSGSMTYVQQ